MSDGPDGTLGLAPASLSDYRELARRALPRQLFDYIDGGSYAEATLRANVDDLRRVRLRQRVLCDVSDVSFATTVLGEELALPVVLAPVGLGGMFARRAEVAAARAAERAGARFCESTVSICSVEEVRRAVSGPFWFQLYVMRDRGYTAELMSRARAAGCSVLVLTVDLPVMGARYRDTRNGLQTHPSAGASLRRAWDIASHPGWVWNVAVRGRPLTFGNLERAVPDARSPTSFRQWIDSQFDPGVTWKDLAWVREHWPGTLVLKGVLDVQDARQAAAEGVQGVIVSNHGGRQLDDVRSTVNVLPAIADAIGERVEVLVDGGVRSGLDVVKMLALGARACLLGRAWAYAVAARGEAGVDHVFSILRDEMRVAMSLTGHTRTSQLSRAALDAL